MNDSAPSASRPLGLWSCVALVMGNMIGVGVFLLPAQLAAFGWNAVIGWVVTIAGGTVLAMVFARLATWMPVTGGPYVYAREAFGPLPAFVVAWSYWVSLWVGNATIATGAVSYLSALAPPLAEPAWAAAATVALVWVLTLVNCRGVQAAGTVQLVTTVLKLLPLLAVIGLAAALIASDGGASLRPFRAEDISFGAVTVVATLTLWPMLGLESATVPADDVRDAARTVPRATLIGTVATGVLYLFLSSALVLLMPPEVLGGSSAPVAAFAEPVWGQAAGLVLAAFVAISALGCLNGWILVQGQLPYALARDGTFPRWFAATSRAGAPVRALVVTSLLLTATVLLNANRSTAELFGFLLLISTSSSLVMYLAVGLAALRLKQAGRLAMGAGMTAAAAIAVVYAAWALTGAGVEASLWCVLLLASGIPVYFAGRWRSAPAPEAAE
ncbi:MAG: amino acid permease [Alphaproteobacteria bacterium]|nr:amino acid permease [Alphaproteobacteria bacterium]